MQPSQDTRVGGEIDLFEFWRILVRRKKLVLASIVVCIAAATGYLMLKEPVYEASVRLRIGQVAGSGPFEPSEVLSSLLTAKYGESIANGVKRDRPFLKGATPSRSSPGVLDLVTEAYTPEEAQALLERLVADILSRHDTVYRRVSEGLTVRLQDLDSQRVALRQQHEDATALIDQLKPGNAVQASIALFDRAQILKLLADLEAERPSVVQRLAPPQTQPTQLLGEIVPPTHPAAPRKALILATASILGLVAGLVLALIAESVARAPADLPSNPTRH